MLDIVINICYIVNAVFYNDAEKDEDFIKWSFGRIIKRIQIEKSS